MEADPSAPPRRWAGIPTDAVVRIVGTDRAALAVALHSAEPGAPAVLGCRVTPDRPAASIIDDLLHQLATVAAALYPSWLPGGENVAGNTGFDRRTAGQLARRHAATTPHYGPFLEALADDALTGGATTAAFAPEVRAPGLARALGDAYRRRPVVVLVESQDQPADHAGLATAAGWLADHGKVGVWLAGDQLAGIERFPAVRPNLPEFVAGLPPVRVEPPPQPDYPPLAGLPHPASHAERILESRLRRLAWADGRAWNQLHRTHPLNPPMRVDLMWPAARCAVELDGPDHRGALKYADDRRRDNALVLDGYAVLRFTNDDVHGDVDRVLATIERLVTTRRP